MHGGRGNIYISRVDGAGGPRRLIESEHQDGSLLTFSQLDPSTGWDIWMVALSKGAGGYPEPGVAQPLLSTPADERSPRPSPDGNWLAYEANESGAFELYVTPIGRPGQRKQISSGGAQNAAWSPTRPELFFQRPNGTIMTVVYEVVGESFVVKDRRSWLDARADVGLLQGFDLSRDGNRIAVLMINSSERIAPTHVIRLDFFDILRQAR
jgi:hypothetical protein